MTMAGPPPHRPLSPRPLAFHLTSTQSTWLSGAAAFPAFLSGLAPIHPSLGAEAAHLRQACSGQDPAALAIAVSETALERIGSFLAGVSAYHAHPAARQLADAPAALSLGAATVRDFSGNPGARPILAVPSLINPAHILDLDEDLSLMRFLAHQGHHPFLLDWGVPGEEELRFSLDDYIDRLVEALAFVVEKTGRRAILLGYCMGGNLALAAALRRPDLIEAAAFLAVPWDFHAEGIAYRRAVGAMMSGALAALPPGDPAPVDLLQVFFASLDPTLTDRKFRRFAALDPASPAARTFVLIEDWANGGAPLAHAVTRQCLYDWYGENTPGRLMWRVRGEVVDPNRLSIPAFVAIPRSDRIVPPASALALAHRLPHAHVHHASAGHVAMVAGPSARDGLWQPLVAWIADLG